MSVCAFVGRDGYHNLMPSMSSPFILCGFYFSTQALCVYVRHPFLVIVNSNAE